MIYGMFIAIVVPVAREEKPVLWCVIISAVLSLSFNFLPILKEIPSGFIIIICALIASAVMAAVSPIKEETA